MRAHVNQMKALLHALCDACFLGAVLCVEFVLTMTVNLVQDWSRRCHLLQSAVHRSVDVAAVSAADTDSGHPLLLCQLDGKYGKLEHHQMHQLTPIYLTKQLFGVFQDPSQSPSKPPHHRIVYL